MPAGPAAGRVCHCGALCHSERIWRHNWIGHEKSLQGVPSKSTLFVARRLIAPMPRVVGLDKVVQRSFTVVKDDTRVRQPLVERRSGLATRRGWHKSGYGPADWLLG